MGKEKSDAGTRGRASVSHRTPRYAGRLHPIRRLSAYPPETTRIPHRRNTLGKSRSRGSARPSFWPRYRKSYRACFWPRTYVAVRLLTRRIAHVGSETIRSKPNPVTRCCRQSARTHLAELEVVGLLDGLRGRVHAHRRGAESGGLEAHDASAADGRLRAKGGTGRDGRRARDRHSHGSHFPAREQGGCKNELDIGAPSRLCSRSIGDQRKI